jgi:hypothetical protein
MSKTLCRKSYFLLCSFFLVPLFVTGIGPTYFKPFCAFGRNRKRDKKKKPRSTKQMLLCAAATVLMLLGNCSDLRQDSESWRRRQLRSRVRGLLRRPMCMQSAAWRILLRGLPCSGAHASRRSLSLHLKQVRAEKSIKRFIEQDVPLDVRPRRSRRRPANGHTWRPTRSA